jgi:hypothetical protein
LTDAEATIQIESRGRASEADIGRMVAGVAAFRREDEERMAQIEVTCSSDPRERERE